MKDELITLNYHLLKLDVCTYVGYIERPKNIC